MRRSAVLIAISTFLFGLTACGYHTVGSATHLPPGLPAAARTYRVERAAVLV